MEYLRNVCAALNKVKMHAKSKIALQNANGWLQIGNLVALTWYFYRHKDCDVLFT